MRGRGYRGDIAIDDSEVKNGPCPPPGSCDFERGLCAYQNDLSGDDFDWERNTGHTTSIGTGPSIDHTTGTTKGSNQISILWDSSKQQTYYVLYFSNTDYEN